MPPPVEGHSIYFGFLACQGDPDLSTSSCRCTSSSPFQVMEEEAYHAFREWHLFLVMRQKELESHLVSVSVPNTSTEPKPELVPQEAS